jgi:two-component system, NtrC family, sensor kinase
MQLSDSAAAIFKPWQHILQGLSGKLVVLLVSSMALVFGVLGYLNIKIQKQHLERNTLESAERISNVIKRNASYYMMRNERDGLYHMISDIGSEPGIVRIRIFNQEGQISFSSDPRETNTLVNKQAEACYGCHSQSQPLSALNRPDRFRTYTLPDGKRALGIINPIENSPTCSSALCHAHSPEQKILGVLDTNLSLASADANVAQLTRRTLLYTIAAVLLITGLSVLFVVRVVHGPLAALEAGTHRLTTGDLGYQIHFSSRDELADLAVSFNQMSRQLGEAREEITSWNRTLEERVEQKTRELNQAHEQMLRAERMASIGKLAAVVAHEINNPLAGILTYAKLLKKRLTSGKDLAKDDTVSSLDLIESESRRCGEIVRNLMSFARVTPMTFEPSDLNAVIRRCQQLVKHQLELAGIEARLILSADLPTVRCDPAQIEQVILSLVMNAIDALPRGGSISIRSRPTQDLENVEIQVQDDGVGIPADVLPNLFEPFFTTKERGHGLGLGLAISRTIIERHSGGIEVSSEPGHGTIFTITLPVGGEGGLASTVTGRPSTAIRSQS